MHKVAKNILVLTVMGLQICVMVELILLSDTSNSYCIEEVPMHHEFNYADLQTGLTYTLLSDIVMFPATVAYYTTCPDSRGENNVSWSAKEACIVAKFAFALVCIGVVMMMLVLLGNIMLSWGTPLSWFVTIYLITTILNEIYLSRTNAENFVPSSSAI